MPLKAKSSVCAAVRTYDVIVFDLDGVIIDSARDLVAAARYSLHQVGSSDRDFSLVRSYIGGGARNLLLRCLDEDKRDRIDEVLNIFKAYYEENCTAQTILYPGVRDVLAFYAGKKHLALATFKIRPATLKILTALDIRDYFQLVVTADDVQRSKPDPECINHILRSLHCDSDAALLVGDTRTDVLTGKNAGVATCAVSYGIGTRQELEDAAPDFIIDDIRELKNIVAVSRPGPQHLRP